MKFIPPFIKVLLTCFLVSGTLIVQAQGPRKYYGTTGFSRIPVLGIIHSKIKHHIQMTGYDSGAGLVSYTFGTGTSTYYGDLCDKYSCMVFRPNMGIGAIYRWDPRISFRGEVNYYKLFGKDVWEGRNFHFKSNNFEGAASVMYDIFPYHKRYKKRRTFSPYAFMGFGFTYFNPKGEYQGKWYALEPLHTEGRGYSRVTPMIPFGFGVRVKYRKGFDFLFEAGYRKTFTDRLDDVSSRQFRPLASFSDPKAAALSNPTQAGDKFTGYRGNPTKKDGYFIFQAKIMYTPALRHLSIPRYRHKVGTRTH